MAFYQRPGIARAWLNNGGDIALHLAPGQSVRVGLLADLAKLKFDGARPNQLDGRFTIAHAMPARGVTEPSMPKAPNAPNRGPSSSGRQRG